MNTNEQQLVDKRIVNLTNAIPLILLTISLLALSLTAIFIKFSLREISANSTVFNRLWIATIIFGIWRGIYQRQNPLLEEEQKAPTETVPQTQQRRDILLLILVALVHIAGRFLWTWSLTETTAANGTVLANLTPIFTTLGGWLFLKQVFDRRFLIGLALAITGSTTLAVQDWFISPGSFLGDASAFTSAIFYSASFLILEELRNQFSVEKILFYRCLIGTALMIPVVLIFEQQILPISVSGWFAVIGLALICEALGHGLVVYSLKHFTSAFVTVFMLLEPIIAATLAWFIFSEHLNILNLVGFGLIMQGVYLAKTGKGADQTIDPETID